ncbi:MAG: helix-turn-helix transcriptional regulator [Candidatus Nephthysia bennettiae]|uniref:Response regulator transcription factor n=2 Tax=Candidatus Nephthysia bennettiae TaxID=3127016 RepID=A0A934JWL3_9BACT|nr:response regulator transcription factor [Candidatus Dormibacteraeota bacterium]MBJ7614788.1 response regulator transcription factor [Candidatus Dormibacteraeota bacterium]PZR93112.1 MAG: helix-turn-helix transcriptional regulator [Candidatus Dormibacteraeota bacterium]
MINSGPRSRERVQVFVAAGDPVSRDGAASLLRGQGVELVDDHRLDRDVVAVVVVDDVDDQAAQEIRSLRRRGVESVVVVATRVDDGGLLAAVEAGASGVLRRQESSPQNLLNSIHAAAAGEGSLPPDLLGRLLGQVGRLQRQVLSPHGLTFSGLTEREVKVLKLLADGLDTSEVGRQLFLSERTIKNVVHDVTSRLNLRNRTHAVAYALRHGFI